MRKLLLFIAVITLFGTAISAQCPSSNREGIHVVQYGQTLFRISKMYNVSIDNLREWNGMQFNELLSVCQELRIVPNSYYNTPSNSSETATYPPAQDVMVTRSATSPPPPVMSKPFNSYQRQSGGKHLVQPGETIANIARLYGYTEERFREFNVLRPGQEITSGSVLLSTDCSCARVSYAENANGLFTGQWNEQLIPQEGNYYGKEYTTNSTNHSANTNNPTTYTNPYYTPPNANTATSTIYNGGAATSWGNVARNNQNNGSAATSWGNATTGMTNTNPDSWRPVITNPTTPTTSNPNTFNNERLANSYMSSEELAMVAEINLVRSNPAGYVRYVEQYIQDIRSGKAFGSSTTAAYELIDELKRTSPLSVLKPVECLFKAAQQHGQDAVRKGSSDHQGTDGSWPWDRALRACPQMADGNENLVGGPASVREAVMLLLVDDGISNRGHRKTLLQSDWQYVAAYKSGMVGRMPNSWIQMFGK